MQQMRGKAISGCKLYNSWNGEAWCSQDTSEKCPLTPWPQKSTTLTGPARTSPLML